MNNLSYRIIKAALVVGTLDIVSACTHYIIKTGKNPTDVLKFVASGFFGSEAFSGGTSMIVAGLLFHYFIAFSFTIIFFLLYPKIKFLGKNKIATGVLYGILVWCIMNLVVIPSSNIPQRPFNLVNATVNMAILIVCIGIPLSFMANNYYKTSGYK
jgi:hypothetical protein